MNCSENTYVKNYSTYSTLKSPYNTNFGVPIRGPEPSQEYPAIAEYTIPAGYNSLTQGNYSNGYYTVPQAYHSAPCAAYSERKCPSNVVIKQASFENTPVITVAQSTTEATPPFVGPSPSPPSGSMMMTTTPRPYGAAEHYSASMSQSPTADGSEGDGTSATSLDTTFKVPKSLDDLPKGKVIIVFLSTRCGYCMQLEKDLKALPELKEYIQVIKLTTPTDEATAYNYHFSHIPQKEFGFPMTLHRSAPQQPMKGYPGTKHAVRAGVATMLYTHGATPKPSAAPSMMMQKTLPSRGAAASSTPKPRTMMSGRKVLY